MMFWIKPTKIHVDCFTYDEIVYNNFKIDRAKEFIPDWWKKIPNNQYSKVNTDPNSSLHIRQLTVKQCNGFRDLFQEGMIFPSWVDAQIEMLDDGKFYISGHDVPSINIEVGYHGREQITTSVYENCGQIKLVSPWFLEEKTGVKFSWMPCMWHNTHNIELMHVLTGVMDFKTQKATNINMYIKKGSIVKIHAGDPLVHMIPLSDKKLEVHHHLLSHEEFKKRMYSELNAGNYANVKKVKQNKEEKCPFGFGK